MTYASPKKTMTETWKALPQTDRWNCQPRRGVMLRSGRFAPPFIFPNYPLRFPFIFPMFHPFIYQTPRTAIPAIATTFKTLITLAFTPFCLMTRSLRPSSLYPGMYSCLRLRLIAFRAAASVVYKLDLYLE